MPEISEMTFKQLADELDKTQSNIASTETTISELETKLKAQRASLLESQTHLVKLADENRDDLDAIIGEFGHLLPKPKPEPDPEPEDTVPVTDTTTTPDAPETEGTVEGPADTPASPSPPE